MELSKKKMYLVLTVMMIGAFSGSLSQSLLTSALPSIMLDFNINVTLGQWLTTIYIMVLGIATSTTAYLINRFNTKYLFISAMSLFFIGCIISIFSPNFIILIFSRILQASGAGVMMPLIQVTALNGFPSEEHGRVMGLVGFVIAFGPAIGPTLSGVIVDLYGWRSIFYILSIVSLLVISAGFLVIKDMGEKIRGKMDFFSASLYGIGFSALMFGVTFQEVRGLFDIRTLAAFGSGFILIYIFIKRQLKMDEPLLRIDLFKSFTFSITTILGVITYWSLISGTIMVPLFIQSVKGMSALTSGLVLLPGSILLAVLSPLAGYLYDKYSPRLVALIGIFLLTIGGGSYAFFSIDTSLITAAFFYAFRMSGIAFLLMPLTAYGIGTLNKDSVAHGTAIVISIRQMLGALGTSILVAIMAAASSNHQVIDMQGIKMAFGLQGVIILMAFMATWRYIK